MRKLALALACASILGTSNVHAIGLGEMEIRSYLDQPLRAEIPLTDVSASELEKIRATFASAGAFEEQGMSLGAVAGRVQVQVMGGKLPRIVLTSNTPVRDPVLGVVLELEGPAGVLRRAYDILLDPVSYRPAQPVVSAVTGRSASAAAATTSRAATVKPAAAETSGAALKGRVENGRYIVRSGETLWRIAHNLRPDGVSTEQMMAALHAANPQAFADPSRVETLLSGASLRIPALGDIRTAKVVKPQAPAALEKVAEPAEPAPSAVAVAKAEVASEPRVAIVAPVQPVAPVVGEVVKPAVVAPMVGEVVSPSVTAGETPAPGGAGSDLIQMQEQLEALKIEKEQLHLRLGSSEGQMDKMAELLRLKDEQIAELEKLVAEIGQVEQRLETATAPESSVPAESEKTVEAQVSRPPAPVPQPVQDAEQGGLMNVLTNPVTLGAGGLVALLLALLIGRQRRRREQEAALQSVPLPESPSSTEASALEAVPAAVAGVVVGGAIAAGAEGQPIHEATSDPVQAALDEVDVMQAYGLHERARGVLDDAIARMPEDDVLQARRIRLFHEMGAKEDFLQAAEEYRATHPAADDPHWAGIQAIGEASYADASLFGGAGLGVVAAYAQPGFEPSPAAAQEETFSPSWAEQAPEAQPVVEAEAGARVDEPASSEAPTLDTLSLELPPMAPAESQESEVEALAALDLDAVALTAQKDASVTAQQPAAEEALELPMLDLGEFKGMESQPPQQAAEPESLPALDLQSLSLEPVSPAVMEEQPAPALAAEESSPLEQEQVGLEALSLPANEAVAGGGAISEDDLMLLGLDASSIQVEPLDLSDLPLVEEQQAASEPIAPVLPSFVESAPALASSGVQEEETRAPVEPVAALNPGAFDEREVKLEMAQALVDLGDHEGARSMLEEVAAAQDDELSVRAREMLERTTA